MQQHAQQQHNGPQKQQKVGNGYHFDEEQDLPHKFETESAFGHSHSHSHDHDHTSGHSSHYTEDMHYQHPDEDEEEAKHFKSILEAFAYYEEYTLKWVEHCEESWNKLADRHKV